MLGATRMQNQQISFINSSDMKKYSNSSCGKFSIIFIGFLKWSQVVDISTMTNTSLHRLEIPAINRWSMVRQFSYKKKFDFCISSFFFAIARSLIVILLYRFKDIKVRQLCWPFEPKKRMVRDYDFRLKVEPIRFQLFTWNLMVPIESPSAKIIAYFSHHPFGQFWRIT